jgi:hypothetical protein
VGLHAGLIGELLLVAAVGPNREHMAVRAIETGERDAFESSAGDGVAIDPLSARFTPP